MKASQKIGLAAVLSLVVIFGTSAAQKPQPAQPPQYQQQPAPIALEKIADNIYQVTGGSGANCGVVIGEKEVMVIDAKMSEESAKQMLAEIAKISPVPVRVLAFTHSDGDHVNGITGFPADIKILAHEETKHYMDEAFKDERQRAYLPLIRTFPSASLEYDLGGRKVQLIYFGPAHTSGDVVVYCPKEKVAFLGDLYAEVFLSGHAEKATRADVKALIKSIEDKQAQIEAMIAKGKSLDEVKKFYKVEDRPATPGRPQFLSLAEVIWLEVWQKQLILAPRKK